MHSGSGKPGELALLKQIRARAAQRSHGVARGALRLGIGDDCALLRIGVGEELAVTTDLSIDGRHFRLAWHSPESIGHRTLARGLSDLAAMGARPVAAFLSLGLPKQLVQNQKKWPGKKPWPAEKTWFDRFLDGFFAVARAHQTPLAGGDLAESPIVVADIVLAGAVRRGKALLRSGARAGDLLYVTGTLGGSAAGLARLAKLAGNRKARSGPPRIPARLQSLLAPHLFPQPRIAQGQWLAQRGLASAAIDLSDGLSTDLAHLCEESQVAAEVNASTLPVHPGTTLEQALQGGEDYELLFTAPQAARVPRRIAGVPVTRIGRILRPRKGRPQVVLVNLQGGAQARTQDAQLLTPQGWEHFS
ncbi:MAG: thiamine-phosphate kinase [Terracidiphilus sp.]|jgi:thiamine-monophosphate kinase